ncbi:MAG: phage terminase large subunit [Verrucomicrobiota bacterium]
MKTETELRPQPKQEEFLRSKADIAIFGGSAGGGKSFALLLEPLYHCENPEFRAVIFRRTVPMLRQPGGLWDASSRVFPRLGATAKETTHEWIFPLRAAVKFSGMELEADAYGWQGSEICLLAFDEVTQFSESQFFYMLSRNRSTCGVKPYVRATCNPDSDSWLRTFLQWWIDDVTGLPIKERSGVLRWFIRREDELHWADTRAELVQQFGSDSEPKSVTFIPSNIHDNKILLERDPGYLANLKALPLIERAQLLDGNWNVRATAGNYFKREWFQIVDRIPETEIVARCRSWDRAATEKKPGNDPDATVGLLLSKTAQNIYYIEDVRKMYASPHTVETAMLNCAKQDGIETIVAYMQDPGSAGVHEAQSTARALDGFNVKYATATGDKETRAKPTSAQAEAGSIKIVRGKWNDEFLRELENFPTARHDDCVDALTGAHAILRIETPFHFTPVIVRRSRDWIGRSPSRSGSESLF